MRAGTVEHSDLRPQPIGVIERSGGDSYEAGHARVLAEKPAAARGAKEVRNSIAALRDTSKFSQHPRDHRVDASSGAPRAKPSIFGHRHRFHA